MAAISKKEPVKLTNREMLKIISLRKKERKKNK